MIAAGQAAVKLAQLFLAMVLVRMLSPTDWNATAYLLSIYVAATAIGTLNLQHNIVFFLPRAGGRGRALVAQNMALLAGLGLLLASALAIAGPALSGGRLGTTEQLRWLAVAIALELPCACTDMTLIALQRFGLAAIWNLIGTIVLLAATITPVLLAAGSEGIVAGLVVAGAVRLAGTLLITGFVLDGSLFGLDRGTLRAQLVYGLPLGVSVAAQVLNRLVDKWYVALFRSGDFGVYAIAAQEVPLLSVLPYAGGAAVVAALVDAFRTGDLGLARTHWIHLTRTMSAVVVPLSFGVVLVAPEALTLIFTDHVAAGIVSFQLFTLITVHRVAEYGMVLRAAGRTRDLVAVSSWTLIANVVLAGAGAAAGGMTGASLGTLVASMSGWLFALTRISRALHVPLSQSFAWRAWSTMVAISASSALAVWGVLAIFAGGLPAGGSIALKLAGYVLAVSSARVLWRRSRHSAMPDVVVVPPPEPRVAPRPERVHTRERSDALTLAAEALR